MASTTSTPEALRTMRQRGSVFLGVVTVAIGVVLAAWSLLSGEPSTVFIGFMLLVAGSGWALFWAPSLLITHRGVHVHNPFRRTVVPWNRLDDVATRWNLEIYHGEQHVAAWAVASHIERPRGVGLMGLANRRLETAGSEGPPVSKGVTVRSAADSISTAKGEWEEMVAEGHPAVTADGEVTRTWVWVDALAIGGPILVIVLGFLL